MTFTTPSERFSGRVAKFSSAIFGRMSLEDLCKVTWRTALIAFCLGMISSALSLMGLIVRFYIGLSQGEFGLSIFSLEIFVPSIANMFMLITFIFSVRLGVELARHLYATRAAPLSGGPDVGS